MKMKERFHAICRFLTMVSQGNHRVLFWLLGSAFAAATLPYLSLFFSARILNLLLAKSYRACLYTVVVFLLTQYGLGLFEKICRQYLDGQKELCLARTEQKITAKALELEFEKFEKTETMDAIRRTNVSSMGSGNVGDQLIVIHTLITSLLSVLYALFFLLRLFLLSDSSRNNFFTSSFSMLALLLLCGVQLALSSRINRRSTQKKIELNQGNDHSNSVANYLVNVMLEERRADDIRIGHLDHFSRRTVWKKPWNTFCRCTSTSPASPPSQTEKTRCFRSFPISLCIFFYRLCFIVLLKDLCGQSIAAIPRKF